MTTGTDPHAAFLLAYFTADEDGAGEQIRFAVSEGPQPLHWEVLHGGQPVLTSTIGQGGVRDPFIARVDDGFVLVATDLRTWPEGDWGTAIRHGSRSIVVWKSADLVAWARPELVEVAPPTVGNVWAPKVFFSSEREAWAVFWSSAVFEAEAHVKEDRSLAAHQRILVAFTRDFRSFSDAEVVLDRGYDTIDANFIRTKSGFLRFTVDHQEALGGGARESAITIDRGESLLDPYYRAFAHGVGLPAIERGEGPAVGSSSPGGSLWLLIDEFGGRGYQLFQNDSDASGPWIHRPDARLPRAARHGSLLSITAAEQDRLRGHPDWS